VPSSLLPRYNKLFLPVPDISVGLYCGILLATLISKYDPVHVRLIRKIIPVIVGLTFHVLAAASVRRQPSEI
jgi:uncharacterized protein YacL